MPGMAQKTQLTTSSSASPFAFVVVAASPSFSRAAIFLYGNGINAPRALDDCARAAPKAPDRQSEVGP